MNFLPEFSATLTPGIRLTVNEVRQNPKFVVKGKEGSV